MTGRAVSINSSNTAGPYKVNDSYNSKLASASAVKLIVDMPWAQFPSKGYRPSHRLSSGPQLFRRVVRMIHFQSMHELSGVSGAASAALLS